MLANNTNVYFYNQITDMRKSIDTLSILVASELERNPSDGATYVFVNRSRDKVKILYWDRNGFVLYYKRLEKSRYKLPPVNGDVYKIEMQQLQWILSGLDFTKITGLPRLNYSEFI